MKIKSRSNQNQGSDQDQCLMCTHITLSDQDQLDEAIQVHLLSTSISEYCVLQVTTAIAICLPPVIIMNKQTTG